MRHGASKSHTVVPEMKHVSLQSWQAGKVLGLTGVWPHVFFCSRKITFRVEQGEVNANILIFVVLCSWGVATPWAVKVAVCLRDARNEWPQCLVNVAKRAVKATKAVMYLPVVLVVGFSLLAQGSLPAAPCPSSAVLPGNLALPGDSQYSNGQALFPAEGLQVIPSLCNKAAHSSALSMTQISSLLLFPSCWELFVLGAEMMQRRGSPVLKLW